MNAERAQRKLAAILSADVKGYSRLMEQDELGTVATLKECQNQFASWVTEYRGRVVDSPGDNVLAEFASVVDAVECALKIQKGLCERNAPLPEDRRMEFRIGINLGDVIADGERLYGDGINIAARVQSLAPAGGICISGTAYDQIENKLPLTCDYLGEYQVKNISKPVRVYAIREGSAKTLPRPTPKPRKHFWTKIAIALAVVLVIAGIWIGINRKPPSSLHENPVLAVLPFVDMSPSKDQEYFADGLTDELLNMLCQIPELRVVGRTSSYQFKGKNEDLRAIGRKLNASAILEGSVCKEGRRVRITTQLINAENGFHIWSETYDRQMDDIFSVQDQIAKSVSYALKVTLVDNRTLYQRPKNSDAYNAYILSQYYGGRRTQEDLGKAVEYLNQAIKLDSNYALAWNALAGARMRQADWGYIPVKEGFGQAREAILRALVIDPDLALAYSSLGYIKMYYDWNWAGADSAFRRSLELKPDDARILGNAAGFSLVMGRFEECLSMARRAVQLDPLNLMLLHKLGSYAYYAGKMDEAATALRKALELNPKASSCHEILGLILLQKNQPQDALVEMEQETNPIWRFGGMALAHYALGNQAASDNALAQLITNHQSESAYEIAQVFTYRGEMDKAFEWLERAYKQRDSGLSKVKVDPLLNNLRGDPRYVAFLKEMGFDN